jgi:benzoyl-CoA 2,3-dioxygenase component B
MVYLLHRYCGRDGREEAEALLARRSGDADNPRILGAFNERTPDWLSFFMFTFFTDRDGKFQLSALTESAFDPLARTTRFMLTEEGHHMFVGRNGVRRIIERTADVMAREKTDDPRRLRELGVIDLPTIQRYVNFHSSVTVDLFGSDLSSNAATFYTTGLKGRFREDFIADDHALQQASYPVLEVAEDRLVTRDAPALNSLNERLRDDFMKDSNSGVDAWNKALRERGIDFTLRVPHKAFNRQIGLLATVRVNPQGQVVSETEWQARVRDWLPTDEDRAYVQSLMGRVVEPGKFANWIVPPSSGINGQPVDFEYVRFN